MKKVLFVATVVKKHINVFHIPFLKMFKENNWETSVAAKNDFESNEECKIEYCDNYYDVPFCRNPLSLENIKAYKMLKKMITENDYDIIHCHTPVGGMLTRLASIKARKKGTRVIYTAHGFHFYKGAPLKNWLFFYPVERFCSRFTDTLITINKEDYAFAKRKMKAKNIEYVPGVGIDVEKFRLRDFDKNFKKNELDIKNTDIIMLSVGELNDNKNHKIIIEVLAKLNNNNICYVIAGKGDKEEYLLNLANKFKVNLKLLGYRTDINELLNTADIFAFPSIREGLSVSLMEAMAAGLPCVVSNIRGNADLIDSNGGFLCDPNNSQEFANALSNLCNNLDLRQKMGEYNSLKIKKYDKNIINKKMSEIYNIDNN